MEGLYYTILLPQFSPNFERWYYPPPLLWLRLFILPANKVWGVYWNHPVRPSMYLVSATPPKRLIGFYETLHICSTLPADLHEEIWLLSKI